MNNNKKKKILFISYGHPESKFLPGGGALRIHKFAEYLAKNGYDVFYLAGNFPGSENVKSNYKTIFLGRKDSPYISLLSFSFLLPYFISKNSNKFDLIVEDQSPFFASFSPFFHKKSVIQFQVYVGRENFKRFPFPFNLFFYLNELYYHRIFNLGVFMSEYLVKAFGWDKFNSKSKVVIYSGVEKENFDYKGKEENFILYCGRLSSYMKGLDVLFQAIKKGKKFFEENNIYFAVVGDGPDRAELEKFSRENNLPVKFFGWISSKNEIAKFYSGCLFSVLPSRYEGFGLSILEAASFGKTTLISDIPVFSWAKHFCLTFRKNSPDDLLQKMIFLFSNKDLRRELGVLGRAFAKDKTWDVVSHQFLEFIESILDGKTI
jgi:glycosyltransferase involved in cell wall biosynthesis